MLQVSRSKKGEERGSTRVLMDLLREEGPFGVWNGCLPMLQTVGASCFVYFFLFEATKSKLKSVEALKAWRKSLGSPNGQVLLASSLAGALNMIITEPLWRASVVLQSKGGGERSVLHAVVRMWRSEGLGALWRGLALSLWLVCNPVIQFFSYDFLKDLLPRLRVAKRHPDWLELARHTDKDISNREAFVIGAIAKAIATLVSFPLIVAQSRLRAQEIRRSKSQDIMELARAAEECESELRRTSLTANGQEVVEAALCDDLLETVNKSAEGKVQSKGFQETDQQGKENPSTPQVPEGRVEALKKNSFSGLGLRARIRSSSSLAETLGMFACLRQLWKENGIQGLYLGLVPKLSQTVLNAAFMFMFYEQILRSIGKIMRRVPGSKAY